MKLSRTPLLMEFGPYGPSLRGTTGFQSPLSIGRFSTYPYNLNPCLEKERQEAAMRRRSRLQELVRDWSMKCSQKGKRASSQTPEAPEAAPSLVR